MVSSFHPIRCFSAGPHTRPWQAPIPARAYNLAFADGSTMRNDFQEIEINPKLEADKFQPAIPPDFKVVEPLKKQ